jgi:hypothetical protein
MKLRSVQEAVVWLRDVANGDPGHPRSRWYFEAANDLEERMTKKPETAEQTAIRLRYKPHTP